MNIFSNLAKNLGKTEEDMTDEEIAEAKRAAQKLSDRSTGPRKVKYLTNGQVRRMQERSAKAEQRKTNRRYRRDWMSTQQHLANLRGRVRATTDPDVRAGTAKLLDLEVQPISPALRRNAMRGLERQFGEHDPETGKLTNDPRQVAVELLAASNRARKA